MRRLLLVLSIVGLLIPIAVSAEETGPVSSIYCPNLTRTLSFGSRGEQVTELQHFLSDFFDLSPEDTITGYFGRLTRANVQKFQCQKMGLCYGDESTNGYGLVGRMTRAAIQNSCGTQTSTPTPVTTNPSCTLSISPSTLIQGQTAQLSWASTNAIRGTITPGVGAVGASGSTELSILNTTTFTGTFVGVSGTATCSVTATIINPTTNTGSCTFNNLTLSNGASVVAYQSQSVAQGQSCAQETRTCTNGTLSGSYAYSSCTTQTSSTGLSCTFNDRTVAHGASVTAYQSASVAGGSTCLSQTRMCSNGILSGSYTNASCNVQSGAMGYPDNADILLWGVGSLSSDTYTVVSEHTTNISGLRLYIDGVEFVGSDLGSGGNCVTTVYSQWRRPNYICVPSSFPKPSPGTHTITMLFTTYPFNPSTATPLYAKTVTISVH